MKKTFIAMLSCMLFIEAVACDICGGGVNNLNPYLFPHLSKSYIGLSYIRNHYRLDQDGNLQHQYSNTVLLTGQYTIKDRVQLMLLLPFQFNTVTSQNQSVSTQGIGDITILASYLALQRSIGKTRHVISAGAGIKLATGSYNVSKSDELVDRNFQLGTSSTDYLMNLVYRFNIGNFSLNTVGSYKYTTPGNDGYRYGDLVTANMTAVYVMGKENFSIAPYVQLINETHYRDADNHVLQNHSGGDILYTGGGVDVSVKRMTIGINGQVAANQNLLQGELQAKPRFSARLSFSL